MKSQHGGKRKGAGRPKDPNKRSHLTATVAQDTKKEIDRRANIAGVSRGIIIDFFVGKRKKSKYEKEVQSWGSETRRRAAA